MKYVQFELQILTEFRKIQKKKNVCYKKLKNIFFFYYFCFLVSCAHAMII